MRFKIIVSALLVILLAGIGNQASAQYHRGYGHGYGHGYRHHSAPVRVVVQPAYYGHPHAYRHHGYYGGRYYYGHRHHGPVHHRYYR